MDCLGFVFRLYRNWFVFLRQVFIILTVAFVFAASALAHTCSDQFREKPYYQTEHFLPENSTFLKDIISRLKEMKPDTAASDVVKKLINDSERVLSEGAPQSKLIRIAIAYSYLVERPELEKSNAKYAETKLKDLKAIDVDKELNFGWYHVRDLQNLKSRIDSQRVKLRFIFKVGLFDYREWLDAFADYKFIISVSDKPKANFDSVTEYATTLTSHDFSHIAQLVSRGFNATGRGDRKIPNSIDTIEYDHWVIKVRKVLAEIDKVQEKNLREKYAMALYYLVHEFTTIEPGPEKRASFAQVIDNHINVDRLGFVAHLKYGFFNRPEKIKEALDWVVEHMDTP
jgi:hypothetical protein